MITTFTTLILDACGDVLNDLSLRLDCANPSTEMHKPRWTGHITHEINLVHRWKLFLN